LYSQLPKGLRTNSVELRQWLNSYFALSSFCNVRQKDLVSDQIVIDNKVDKEVDNNGDHFAGLEGEQSVVKEEGSQKELQVAYPDQLVKGTLAFLEFQAVMNGFHVDAVDAVNGVIDPVRGVNAALTPVVAFFHHFFARTTSLSFNPKDSATTRCMKELVFRAMMNTANTC
jgi:hypothetical protein